MKNFSEFVKANKEKIYSLARKNTQYNRNGDAVISRDDPWFYDDVWEYDYKELVARDSVSIRANCFSITASLVFSSSCTFTT